MAESVVREALKQGMKSWIVTSERVRTMVAQFREDIEDVVFEARQEYESQADTKAQPDSDTESVAVATAPRRKAARARAKREEPAEATGDAQDAKASAGIATVE
jgi:hypothetical protein